MTKPLALRAQMVKNTLTNRAPIRCPICDRFIATFAGLPVILDDKAKIIVFAHPGCCLTHAACPSWSETRHPSRSGRRRDSFPNTAQPVPRRPRSRHEPRNNGIRLRLALPLRAPEPRPRAWACQASRWTRPASCPRGPVQEDRPPCVTAPAAGLQPGADPRWVARCAAAWMSPLTSSSAWTTSGGPLPQPRPPPALSSSSRLGLSPTSTTAPAAPCSRSPPHPGAVRRPHRRPPRPPNGWRIRRRPGWVLAGPGHRQPGRQPGGTPADLAGAVRQHSYARRQVMVLINGLSEQSESWFRNLPYWRRYFDTYLPNILVYDGPAIHRASTRSTHHGRLPRRAAARLPDPVRPASLRIISWRQSRR